MYFHYILLALIFVQTILAQECSIQGKCIDSEHISTIKVFSVEQCLIKCAITTNCKYSTFDVANNECLKFNTCDEIDPSFTECLTYRKNCAESK